MRSLLSGSLLLCLLASFCFVGGSELSDEQKALSAKNVVFLGVNFSKLRLLNEEGFVSSNGKSKCDALHFKYFETWNDVFVQEKSKFDVSELLDLDKHTLLLDPTKKINALVETEGCLIEDLTYRVSEAEIQDIVKQYVGVAETDICVVMVGESLSKKLDKGVFTVVYFDPTNGKILLSNRYEESPGGYGFDNYWVNTIHKSLESHRNFIKKERKKLKIK